MQGKGHLLTLNELATEPIERIEQDDGTVRYTSIKLLSPGKWTDSGSKQTVWYSPEGIRNLEITDGAEVNIMHDLNPETGEANEVSVIGELDAGSAATDEDGAKHADLVLHMDNAASEYADENLQAALESDGDVGFGGPSVEIPAEGQKLEWDGMQGVYELRDGKIDGAALVWNPASKTVDFSNETQNRAVALSSNSQDSMVLQPTTDGMEKLTLEELRNKLGLSEDIDDKTLVNLYEANALALEEDVELEDDDGEDDDEGEGSEGGEGDGEGGEDDDEGEDDGEDDDTEMEDGEKVAELESRLEQLEQKLEQVVNAATDQSELEDVTDELKQELADSETVDEIEARLSDLEDEPKEPRTMSDFEGDDGGDGDEGSWDWSDADSGSTYDSSRGTVGR